MDSGRRIGRSVGVLLLLQMVCALIVPFILMDALVKGYPAFLETAALSADRIRSGVLLAFVGLGLTVAIGVWMHPLLAGYSKRAALWFVAVCLISAGLDAVHNASVMSMLAVGERFASAGGADGAIHQAWAAVAGSMRRSAHIIQLFGIAAWIATFYVSLWRFRLVPRVLAALGSIGIALQFTGVTAMMFLGYPVMTYLAIPLAPIHAATAIWLIVKGFSNLPDETEAARSES